MSGSERKRGVPSASLTTMGLRGRSNSEAEIFLAGGAGAPLSARAPDGCVGHGQDSERPRASSLQAGMACTRSANQALTISLRTQQGHVTRGRGRGSRWPLPASSGRRNQKRGGVFKTGVGGGGLESGGGPRGRFKGGGRRADVFGGQAYGTRRVTPAALGAGLQAAQGAAAAGLGKTHGGRRVCRPQRGLFCSDVHAREKHTFN